MNPCPFPGGCNYATNSTEELIKHIFGIHLTTNQQQISSKKQKIFDQLNQQGLEMHRFIHRNVKMHRNVNCKIMNQQFNFYSSSVHSSGILSK